MAGCQVRMARRCRRARPTLARRAHRDLWNHLTPQARCGVRCPAAQRVHEHIGHEDARRPQRATLAVRRR